jgi:cellulose synthase (UDP-forming)
MERRKKILYLMAFILSVMYLVWRGLYTLPWEESVFALVFGIFLWISEIISNFTALVLIWSKNSAKEIIKPDVSPEFFPDVDVFIATHNEEVDLLLKTVNAAVNMDYPDKTKVHIYLSDDSSRAEVKELARRFSIGYIGLKDNKHAKSGNLNNALSQTHSPLIATFDADMIPYSNFLLETVPYFVDDWDRTNDDEKEKPLGLIQTPQSFYNADLFQFNLFSENSIPNEQDFFSREVNVLNNAQDAAIYTGSNTLILRKAIDDAGGFPLNTITEDFELGARINAKGYRNISTTEPLASGLTPTDIPSAIKQRVRWGRGVVQSVHNLRVLTNKGLTFRQRLIFINSYLYWWSFVRRLLYITAPILFTVFGIRVVDTDFWTLLLFWLPSYYFIHLSMQDLSSDIRTQQWGEVQETIFAPYMVLPVFFQAIGIKEKRFKVTNKAAVQSKKDILYVVPHFILLILTIVGIVTFNYGKYGLEIFYGSVITFWLLTHLFNLTFSVLFFSGRPIYRHSERFLVEYPVLVKHNSKEYQLMLKNYSENGLSFLSEEPLYFPEDALVHFVIEKDKYKTHLTGKVVRVFEESDGWVFGVKLEEIPFEEYLQYLLVIYDGFNKSLPQFRDPWVNSYDRLLDNINRRQEGKRKKKNEVSKFPIIQINEELDVSGKKITLRRFNYRRFYIDSQHNLSESGNFDMNIDGVPFVLSYITQNDDNEYTFEVDNLAALVNDSAFEALLCKWQGKVGGNL